MLRLLHDLSLPSLLDRVCACPGRGFCHSKKGASIRRIAVISVCAYLVAAPALAATMKTLHAREHRQARSLHAHLGTLRFFRHHQRLARTAVGRREVRRSRVWVPILRREIAETRAQLRPKPSVPDWFVAGALCVHSGWHYVVGGSEYVMFGRGFTRTTDVPDSIAGGSGEGSWDAANGGYGGGMQMDKTFQRRYGSEFLARYGSAGSWPAAVQLLVAYRGWLVQGWGAWPNTSRACGLR